MQGMDSEIEGLRAAVSQYFPITKILVSPFALSFHVAAEPGTLDDSFDGLRRELVPRGYVPSITREPEGFVVHVQRRPEQRFRGTHVNLLLLLATVGTTWVAGALNWQAYAGVPWLSVDALVLGFVSFTVPLLAILGAHEMGHYVTAKRHNVRASLPFFIPSVPFLGTFGAFISMRDPIPNRKALLEIGIAGPLVGFALSVPIAILGLFLGSLDGRPPSMNGGGDITMPSILYGWMEGLFPAATLDPFRRHPTAFAGWVGLFVTAINLLPAGQLDGGHVARALFGERARYFSWGAVLFLFALGILFTYSGWFLFALIILLLGVKHPPPLNDLTKLRPSRQALGVLAIAILILTFVPQPFIQVPEQASFRFEGPSFAPIDTLPVNISAGTSRVIDAIVNNTGNLPVSVDLELNASNLDTAANWTVSIQDYTVFGGGPPTIIAVGGKATVLSLNVSEYARVRIFVGVPATFSGPPGPFYITLAGRIVNTERIQQVTIAVSVP